MRKKKKDDIGSLDSLLDTITTVVGILIILLIVVQLGAGSAVKRIVDEKKEENSIELMELAMKQFEDQKKNLNEEKKRLQLQQASQNKDQQKLIEEISELEKELSDKKKGMPPVPPPLQNLRQEKSKLFNQKNSIEVKFRKVKGLLSSGTDQNSKSMSKDISLPDPKPAVPGSKPFRFLCREGMIYPINESMLYARIKSALTKSGPKPNKDGEYESSAFINFIHSQKISTSFFTVKVSVDGGKVMRFTVERKRAAGEDEMELVKPSSEYLKALAGISPKTHYLLFEVFPDSFGTYLSARELSNGRKFPAGWKPANRSNDWWGFDWGYRAIGRKAMIAARTKPKSATGKPVPAKKPANVLD